MRRLLALPLTAFALAFSAGCGDDEETASTPSTPAASTETAAPATDGTRIGMKGLKFLPAEVTVKTGTKVTWVNDEDIPHNVVAEEGAEFESDTFGRDGTYEFTPEEPGSVKYVCTLHPGMNGTLTVEG